MWTLIIVLHKLGPFALKGQERLASHCSFLAAWLQMSCATVMLRFATEHEMQLTD